MKTKDHVTKRKKEKRKEKMEAAACSLPSATRTCRRPCPSSRVSRASSRPCLLRPVAVSGAPLALNPNHPVGGGKPGGVSLHLPHPARPLWSLRWLPSCRDGGFRGIPSYSACLRRRAFGSALQPPSCGGAAARWSIRGMGRREYQERALGAGACFGADGDIFMDL